MIGKFVACKIFLSSSRKATKNNIGSLLDVFDINIQMIPCPRLSHFLNMIVFRLMSHKPINLSSVNDRSTTGFVRSDRWMDFLYP